MDNNRALVEAFTRRLDGFTEALSTIVSDGTSFGNFPRGLTSDLLDAAEQKLGLAACYMRTIRNAHTPACRLPREILDIIFALTMDRFGDFDPFPIYPEYDGRWHPSFLSGVCRYWRAVTLSSPVIWSTIYLSDTDACGNLTFAQLCLRRSYGSPLRVYIDYLDGIPEDVMNWISEDLVAHSVRFHGFHLKERNTSSNTALYGVLSECPAPELRSLTLRPDAQHAHPRLQGPLLFAGFLPCIKHIATSYLKLWPAYRLTTLTHVCMREAALSAPEILDLLSCNSQLEVLILQADEPTSHNSEDDPSMQAITVSLPDLRKLHLLKYTTSICMRVLNAIRPSPFLSVEIDYVRSTPSHPLLSSISRLLFVSNVTTVALCCWSSPARLGIRGAGLADINISPGADVHEAGSNQYMAGLLSLLSACPIKEIWIERDMVVTRVPLWQRIFLATPFVSKLAIVPGWYARELSGATFLSALCAIDETLGSVLPCPLLTEIILRGAFNEEDVPGTEPSVWLTRELRQCLTARRSRGFPLRKITLVRSMDDPIPGETELAEMRKLVKTVELVDEKEAPDCPPPFISTFDYGD